jgi:hypothetical protein
MSQQKPAKKAESTVIKPMAKKDRFKNLGGEIGNPPFPNGRKGMPYAPTKMGGAKNGKTMTKAKKGATIKKAQTGNVIVDKAAKDYKAYGAGTGPRPALSAGFKNGGKMKKCKTGCK